MKLGIIGQGFVGSAIYEGLRNFYEVSTYDIDSSKCNSTLKHVCETSDIVFVCLPTPMMRTGQCDTSILEDAIKSIDMTCSDKRPILVIKSTVPPGTTERIESQYVNRADGSPDMKMCFSPEFLTEANSFEDFKNQTRIIIGGSGAKKVKQVLRRPFPNIPIVVTKSDTAEMVKYFTNCFLATKVIFANQMYEACEEAGIDYDKVCEYALHDNRIGKTHLAVPGHDGDRGFGGHCFPKDLSGIIHFLESLGGDASFLKCVREKNLSVRKNRDWETMLGRAVSTKDEKTIK